MWTTIKLNLHVGFCNLIFMQLLEIVPAFTTQLDGKVLPQAHVTADLIQDGATEIVVGTMNGNVVIFKILGDRLIRWKRTKINGTITTICVDNPIPGGETRLFICTLEGGCFVFHFGVYGDEEFRPSAEFHVALNISDVVWRNGDLIFGTQDGYIYIYDEERHSPGGFKQAVKFDIADEVAEFYDFVDTINNTKHLVFRCNSGICYELPSRNSDGIAQPPKIWKAWPDLDSEKSILHIVPNVTSSKLNSISHGISTCNGSIAVVSPTEVIWELQIPDAIAGATKLSIGSFDEKNSRNEILLVLTWSGDIYAIKDNETVIQFRMLFPGGSLFCAKIRDGEDDDAQPEDIVVSISTSGVLLIYRNLIDVLGQAFPQTSLKTLLKQKNLSCSRDSIERIMSVWKMMHSRHSSGNAE